MKKIRIALVLLGLALAAMRKTAAADAATQAVPERVPLEAYLLAAAVRADCYFTIESAGAATADNPAIETDSLNNVDSIVKKLNQNYPKFRVVRSKENPLVVHLIDRALPDDETYPLNRKLDLDFNGPLDSLPNAVGEALEDASVSPRIIMAGPIYSMSLPVVISAEEKPVRRLLSDYLPFSQYYRILWRTDARLSNGKWKAFVSYPGYPLNVVSRRYTVSEPTEPFSEGQIAFIVNRDTKSNVDKAIAYIQSSRKDRLKYQVRWALLFLGKSKSQDALPVLASNLDFLFADVPVRTEKYPVLQSMQWIGEPAKKFALTELAHEKDELRLELWCEVILRVSGVPSGKREIEETINQLKATERPALTKALTAAQQFVEEIQPRPIIDSLR